MSWWTNGKEVYTVVEEVIDGEIELVDVLVADRQEDGVRVILETWHMFLGPYDFGRPVKIPPADPTG